jgi:hypothetical protein
MSMNKSIIVGLVALGLTACSGAVEDQPTDAVTAEAPAEEVAAPAEAPAAEVAVEAAPADAAVVEAPVAQ